jgi:tRNA nucleotidyltransferase (CCA-adding enzyme)
MQMYLVGGCVRDELLGLPVHDRDWVVVGATPEKMLQQGFQQVGKDFPVFLHPKTKEEYALARTERKTGQGYYGFVCNADPSVTLEEDLARRDITINSIAKSEDGKLVDPYNGQIDLKNKILKHVSPAFSEDPVRILRVCRFAARFAALGFSIAAETMQLMAKMVQAGEVDALVPERVWQEMLKALSTQNPEVFFTSLRECGALARIFPALNNLWGVPQKKEYHPEVDTGIHVMMALQQVVKLTNKPEVRFAVLCHDLGKGLTPKAEWPSHKGHEERGIKPIQEWCAQYRVPVEFKELAVKVAKWHLHAHRAAELRPDTMLKLLKGLDAFRNPHFVDDYLIACQSDSTGRTGMQNNAYPAAAIIKQAFAAANSVDVQPLIQQGFAGEKLGLALTEARVSAIKESLDKLPPTS